MNKRTRVTAGDKMGCLPRVKAGVQLFLAAAIPLIAASGMLVYGLQGLQLARRFPAPVTLPYAQFVRRMPQSGWYRIPDATVDLSAAFVRHTDSRSRGYQGDGYYAPVYGPQGPADGPCRLLLCVTDDPLPASRIVARPVQGLVETNLDRSSPLNADVAALGNTLAPGYAVLDDGFRPSPWLSLTLVLIGGPLTLLYVVGVGATLLGKIQSRKERDSQERPKNVNL